MTNETTRTPRSSASRDDEIRELLSAAGPREPVPVEDLKEIRSAARDSWLEMARRERERSRFRRAVNVLAIAASLVLAITIGWWLKPDGPVTGPAIVASVELLRGEVHFDGALVEGAVELAAGTVVETTKTIDRSSGVAVRLSAGQSVRVDAGTRVRLVSGSSLELERGALYIDTVEAQMAAVEISTPHGSVRDLGTQFEVRLGEAGEAELTVRVREGGVELDRGAEHHPAVAGEQLDLLDGTLERSEVAPSSSVWGWILEVTPAMELDGATLAAYLDWVSRETGRELHYASESLAEAAETILVHGSIEGMTPEESLEVVLPGSGLGYEVENGSLVIERP